MLGIGFRAEMRSWDFTDFSHDFIEVVPENWVRRDLEPLRAHGKPVRFHGVSLNLGGTSEINKEMLVMIRGAMEELGITDYSDHLAASGDAHQLYDLFPIPFTKGEATRVADRIKQAQDILGFQMAVENSAYYTNVGDMPEADWVCEVVKQADCKLLLDVNNLICNIKNHGNQFFNIRTDFTRLADLPISYMHIAGHEWSEQYQLHWDTHAAMPSTATLELARILNARGVDALLEWDNDIPVQGDFKEVVQWIRSSGIM